ncbi:type 1 glutamine amidotransferase [Arenibaculum pallidiluteum]|uniref:type 1 glutamine amidotransferase n=1 Tax=Arenibaculum pallidiluteum TaxID=2812559 RepID=UPI001A958CDC|nr:type 1 glutamine amidotransferase [Arenibaculum pallidiluteum]
MKVLVVQNSPRVPAGLVGEAMAEAGAELVTVLPGEGGVLPSSLEGYDGALVLGGAQDAWDDETSPWLPQLLVLLREARERDVPVLGICLGAQLIARAAGALVYRHDRMEVGFRPVRLTDAGKHDPLFVGGPEQVPVLEWHVDTFDLPDGATLLATSADCENQAFRLGSLVGVQFHPEATEPIVSVWRERMPEERRTRYADDVAALPDQWRSHGPEAARFARQLARRWVQLGAPGQAGGAAAARPEHGMRPPEDAAAGLGA